MTQIRHDGASLHIFEAGLHTIVPTNLFVLEFSYGGRDAGLVPLCVVAEPESQGSVLSKFLQAPSRFLHRFCGQLPKRMRSFPN